MFFKFLICLFQGVVWAALDGAVPMKTFGTPAAKSTETAANAAAQDHVTVTGIASARGVAALVPARVNVNVHVAPAPDPASVPAVPDPAIAQSAQSDPVPRNAASVAETGIGIATGIVRVIPRNGPSLGSRMSRKTMENIIDKTAMIMEVMMLKSRLSMRRERRKIVNRLK